MSFSFENATLVIGYSRIEYDTIYVKRTFNIVFGDDFVEDVIEKVFTPQGRPPYKKFYLLADRDHPSFKRITDLTDKYKYASIVYKNEWDRATRKYVDRYWKVFPAPARPAFYPYLMTEAQMSEHYIEPWSPEADEAFETPKKTYTHIDTESEEEDDDTEHRCDCTPCQLNFNTPEFPPPMVRDNGGPFPLVRSVNSPPSPIQYKEEEETDEEYWLKHGPCKLTRMSNECPSVETEEEAADTAKDFDDLAKAISLFGEDYEGTIAGKIPRPPTLARCSTEEWYKFNSCNY
jgi:hypothetical protein